jgi:hypothetical protein
MRRAGLHARACGTCGGSRANEKPRPCAVPALEDVPARTENGGGAPPFREPVRPTASAAAELGRSARRTHRTRRRATFRNWGRLVSPARSSGLGAFARRSDRHCARRAARRQSLRARVVGAVRIGSRLSRSLLCDSASAEARVSDPQGGGSRSRTNRWPSRARSVALRGSRGSRSSFSRGRYLLGARRDLALRRCSCHQRCHRNRSRSVPERRLTWVRTTRPPSLTPRPRRPATARGSRPRARPVVEAC